MEEKTINITDLFMIAWRRLWVIILVAVIFAISAFAYCKLFLTPKYSATASILATNGAVADVQDGDSSKVAGSDISASLYLTHTLVDILNSTDNYVHVVDRIKTETGAEYDVQNLLNRSTIVRRNEDTLFIDVTFTSTDPEEAKALANNFCTISCENISNHIPGAKANVVSKAHQAVKTYPRTAMVTMISAVAGAILTYIVLFIIESTNKAIKGEENFTATFDVPLLGSVPDFENVENNGYRKAKGKGGYSNGY